MQLYDMHTHILPGFDDGAKTEEDALKLIDCLKGQGIRNICLTPHFYTNEMSVEDFARRRNKTFEAFRPLIPDDVRVVLGAEVYVTHYLLNSPDLSEIAYGKSRYILTEFPYDADFGDRTMHVMDVIMRNYGYTAVLPHVERYEHLMNHPDLIEELQSQGVVIQTNIGNYTNKTPFFRKRRLLKFISKGLIDILGSDAHSFQHNTPEVFEAATRMIAEKCGEDRLEEMMRNAADIFDSAME